MRTNQKEKLEVLQNAVLNTALKKSPNDSLQTIFLSLVDRLTPLHLILLRFIQSPPILPNSGNFTSWEFTNQQSWKQSGKGKVPNPAIRFIKDKVPVLKEESPEFIGYLLRDLYVSGLSVINPDEPHLNASRFTDLGNQFLRHVTFRFPSGSAELTEQSRLM